MKRRSRAGKKSVGLSLKKSPEGETNDSVYRREWAEREAALLSDVVAQRANAYFAVPF
jgi:hypothetical protein